MSVAFHGRFLKRMQEGQKGYEKASNFACRCIWVSVVTVGSLPEGKDPVGYGVLLNARGGVLSRGGCQLCLASYTQVYLLTYVSCTVVIYALHDSHEIHNGR